MANTKEDRTSIQIQKIAISSYKQLIVEQRDHLVIVKLNRPAVKNALDRRSYGELIRILREVHTNPSVSVIVITGIGDVFTSGNDLNQKLRYANTPEQFNESANMVQRSLAKAFFFCDKIIVALVNGPCFGVGFTMCSLCDVVYCTEKAYFVAPFSKLGICPEMGSTFTFPMIMGRMKAREMLLFGSPLTATAALQFNFVAEIFNSNQLDSVFWPRMLEYSKLPQISLRTGKRLLRNTERDAYLTALEREMKEMTKLRDGEENKKAVIEFQKRHKNSKL